MSKIKPKLIKTFKNGQKEAIKFDCYCKNAVHRFHQQNIYIINSGIVAGGGYSVLADYQSLLSNSFPLAPPQIFFSMKYRPNILIRVSFTELLDFMIYQHVNKSTKFLPLATSHIAHLCNHFNHVCSVNLYATL